jgi:hypothetical protein
MLFIVGGRFRKPQFASRKMTQREWDEIAKLSGLPPEARSELNKYVAYYQELTLNAKDKYGNLWKAKLTDARKAEAASLKTLEALASNADFLTALAMGLEGQEKILRQELAVVHKWLIHSCQSKKELLLWYDKALMRLQPKSGRPGRKSLFALVQLLNRLLYNYTGTRISRAKGSTGERNAFEYVKKVCELAGYDVTGRDRNRNIKALQEIVKQVVTAHNAREDDFVVESWEEIMPGWKPAEKLRVRGFGIRADFIKRNGSYKWTMSTTQRTPRDAMPIMFPIQPFTRKR